MEQHPTEHLPYIRFKGELRPIATPGDGTNLSKGSYNFISMNGKEVYKFATREVPAVLGEALEAADMTADDIDWLLLHQVRTHLLYCIILSFH